MSIIASNISYKTKGDSRKIENITGNNPENTLPFTISKNLSYNPENILEKLIEKDASNKFFEIAEEEGKQTYYFNFDFDDKYDICVELETFEGDTYRTTSTRTQLEADVRDTEMLQEEYRKAKKEIIKDYSTVLSN